MGLGDLARREGYVERQVRRWSTQWENSKTRELPAIEEVSRLLSRDIPVQQGVSIAHGDYRFGNVLTDVANGRVAAVLDWEICTLGDPMADLGLLMVYWNGPNDDASAWSNSVCTADGFLDRPHLAARYAEKSGRDISQLDFYTAFAFWKLACIIEGVYARYLKGAMGNQDFDPTPMKLSTENLAEAALSALKGN